jgi:HlyD family secretion protein
VSQGAITRAVTATGTINPELTIIVGSYVSGVIKELFCDYNTQVKKGQVCAKIDPRPYQTLVNQAKANLAIGKAQLLKDEANLEYVKLNYERNLRLVQTHAVSQDVADNAKSDYEQARAQIAFDQATIEQREAQLEAAQVNLDYTDITSPVDGTVVSRNVTMGQTVAASFQTPTLFLIASDLKEMQLDTNVSESDIGDLKEGNPATFTVDAFPKRTFVGKVSQVRQSPQTVQNIVTFDVVVSIDNSDLALKPGMTAATRIIVDQRSDAMRIPNRAVRFVPSGVTTGTPTIRGAAPVPSSNTQAQVWALREGIPVAILVDIGLDDESFVEIVGGNLKPGDQVIVAEQRQALGRALPRPRL